MIIHLQGAGFHCQGPLNNLDRFFIIIIICICTSFSFFFYKLLNDGLWVNNRTFMNTLRQLMNK